MTWFAIAGGLSAWTVQLLASYALIDFACARPGNEPGMLGPAVLAISALCAAVALAATLIAAQRAASARGGSRALYVGGALLDALSLVTIAFGAALPLLFDPCLRG